MKRMVLGFLAFLVLAGCQTMVGEGPVTFSPSTAALYQHYLGQDYPAKFAVSVDGKTAHYFYCPWNAVDCQITPDTNVIAACEEDSNGQPCRIFSKKREVVWKDPGNFLKDHAQGNIRLDGTEPVLYGASLSAFQTYKNTPISDTSHKAFAVNYRLSNNELVAFGWRGRRDTVAEAKELALSNCKARSRKNAGSECRLYMVNDEKVWFTGD